MTTGQSTRSSRTKGPSATDHQEIEWQFDAGVLEPVEGWLVQHDYGSSGLLIPPESTVEIKDTYYDTDDWRFYRDGYALRLRNTNGKDEAVTAAAPALVSDRYRKWRKAAKRLDETSSPEERCAREAKDLRSGVLGSKPFRTLTKGKKWKTFEQVLESRSAADIPDKGVR
jgi:hypothetical protein